jgi:hypothetical protein
VYPATKPGLPPSEAIIWDAILPSSSAPWHQNHYNHPTPKKSSSSAQKTKKAGKAAASSPHPRGVLHLENQRPKYQITDISGKLQNRTDVQLELGWNVQPWVGALVWTNWADYGVWQGLKGGRTEAFSLPAIGEKKKGLDTEKGKEGHRLMAGQEVPVGGGN